MAQYVRMRTEEAFPVLYHHIRYSGGRTPQTATGPFYAPGSESLTRANGNLTRLLAAAEAGAARLRRDGWNITVDVVER